MKAFPEEGAVLQCKPMKRSARYAPRITHVFDCPDHQYGSASLIEDNLRVDCSSKEIF